MILKMVSKKGAIELSIGTIVIIVLAMSMLILGLVLVKNIFKGSTNVVDMTNEQLKNQVASIFGEEQKLVVYPDTEIIDIKIGERGAFGIGIRNKISGAAASSAKFSYTVSVSDPEVRKKCGFGEAEANAFIMSGKSDDNLNLAPGELMSRKVILQIPEGTNPCIVGYKIEAKVNGQPYANRFMSIEIKA